MGFCVYFMDVCVSLCVGLQFDGGSIGDGNFYAKCIFGRSYSGMGRGRVCVVW